MRVVFDPNVLISALISPTGPPREIVTAWSRGEFDLIASPMLLAELAEVLARPKLRRWVSETVAAEYLQGLAEEALIADDPPPQPGLSADPGDDYLVALARAAAADHLISGDRHLRDLRDPTTPGPHSPPVHRPAQEPK